MAEEIKVQLVELATADWDKMCSVRIGKLVGPEFDCEGCGQKVKRRARVAVIDDDEVGSSGFHYRCLPDFMLEVFNPVVREWFGW